MEVNDSLKLKAYGWKKNMIEKQPHIEKILNNSNQYYPPDQSGVIDEWGALMKQQDNLQNNKAQTDHISDQQKKKEYSSYLTMQMQEK